MIGLLSRNCHFPQDFWSGMLSYKTLNSVEVLLTPQISSDCFNFLGSFMFSAQSRSRPATSSTLWTNIREDRKQFSLTWSPNQNRLLFCYLSWFFYPLRHIFEQLMFYNSSFKLSNNFYSNSGNCPIKYLNFVLKLNSPKIEKGHTKGQNHSL